MSSLIPKNGSSGSRAARSAVSGHRDFTAKTNPGLKYVVTFAVAAAADGLQVAFPPFWIPVSIVTVLIFFALWGWKWEILCVLIPELAPAVGLFPSWLAIALYLTGREAGARHSHKIAAHPITRPDKP